MGCKKQSDGININFIKNTTWTVVNRFVGDSNVVISFNEDKYNFCLSDGRIIEYGNYSFIESSIVFQRLDVGPPAYIDSVYTLSINTKGPNIILLEGVIKSRVWTNVSWLMVKN